MTLTADQLISSKEDIASVARAVEESDPSQASEKGKQLLDEIVVLDEAAWQHLLSLVDDVELLDHMNRIRERVGQIDPRVLDHINQVGYSVELGNFPSMSMLVKLRFKTRVASRSFDSIQDLEDTLWIGRAVVEAVAETVQSMRKALGHSAQKNCIGDNFQKNLMWTESAIRQIRECYDAIVADADDGAS